MFPTFKNSFVAGAIAALLFGLWLAHLWGSENQVRLHTEHFLSQIEKRDWAGAGEFLAANYRDDWGDDRQLVINRLRFGLRFFNTLTITAKETRIQVEESGAIWSARVQIAGAGSDVVPQAVEEINHLTTPFKLRWQKQSWKPWDWKLGKVSNSELQLPAETY